MYLKYINVWFNPDGMLGEKRSSFDQSSPETFIYSEPDDAH